MSEILPQVVELPSAIYPLLVELVSIDSVNPSLVPGGAGEAAIARFAASWFAHHGIEARVEEAVEGRPNVIAVVDSGSPGRTILLNAHLDTVGVAAMENPFAAELDNGRLRGRGSLDTKGGLAALMLATATAAAVLKKGKIVFTGVIDEEYASVGTESLLGRIQADGAIVAEPTNLAIVTCHKGFVWLEVTTTGVAAHGSKYEDGVDAIAKMGKFLRALNELGDNLQSRRHPILGPASVHASLIEGGQELSSYPASCKVSIERRTLPGETPESVRAEIQSLIDSIQATDDHFHAHCRATFSRDPLEIGSESEMVTILCKQAQAKLQQEPAIRGMSGWTDAALLNAAGIPSVVFGPEGEGMHGAHEWVDLESVGRYYNIVLETVREFCEGEAGDSAVSHNS